jgi:hypothetical protein
VKLETLFIQDTFTDPAGKLTRHMTKAETKAIKEAIKERAKLQKINALVAQHVMGWPEWTENAAAPKGTWAKSSWGSVRVQADVGYRDYEPTVAWADCGPVLDKITYRKFVSITRSGRRWRVDAHGKCNWWSTGKTKQIAICMLALLLRGVDVAKELEGDPLP